MAAKANFSAYHNYVTDSLHQWDRNQVLTLQGINLATAPEVHFSNKNMDRAIVRQATMVNHVVSVNIPNSLLQDPLRIYAHIGIYVGNTFTVVETVEIPVIPRTRPCDYQIEDNDGEVYSFKALENALANRATNARLDNILANVGSSAELVDVRLDRAGKTHGSAGAAVRAQSNRAQPVVCFIGAHFDYDSTTHKLQYVLDDASNQLVSVFEGDRTVNVSFVPDQTEFDLSTSLGTVRYLVANTELGTLRLVTYSEYTPADKEYILLMYVRYKVYIMGLSPLDLYINGQPAYKNTLTRGQLQTIGAKVKVDYAANTVTLPAVNMYGRQTNGVYQVLGAPANALTVAIAPDSAALTYVCYDTEAQTLTVVDRKHEFLPTEYCLLGVCSGEVLPVDLNPACVSYVNRVDNSRPISVNDMLAPMFNSGRTFKIVLGGDSITHGVGGTGFAQDGDVVLSTSSRTWKRNPSGYCWGNLFKSYIESNYNATVLNNGCTGSNSVIWNTNKAALIPADTDLLILTIGTNDRNTSDDITTKAEALAAYYQNITEIVDYCHANDIQVLLASPIPATAANEAEDRLLHIFELNGILQRVAAEHNMEYLNLYNAMYFYLLDNGLELGDYLADGLHPNNAGYRVLFYRYLKLLGMAPSYDPVN